MNCILPFLLCASVPPSVDIAKELERSVASSFISHRVYVLCSEPDIANGILLNLMIKIDRSILMYNKDMELPPVIEFEKRSKEDNVIVITKSYDELSDMLNIISRVRIIGAKTRVIIVTSIFEFPEKILWEAWSKHIFNVALFMYSRDHVARFICHPYQIPFSVTEIGPTDSLFTQKIPKDFYGYPLKATLSWMEPYVLEGYKEGVEIRLINTLAEYYNMTLELVNPPKGEVPRLPFVNNTPNGVIGVVYRHEADITLGGFLRNIPRFVLTEALHMHTEDRLLWAFPKTKEQIDWRSLYRSFSTAIWAFVIAITFVSAITATIVANNELDIADFQTLSLNLFTFAGLIVERASPKLPSTLHLRIFFMLMLLYAIVITTSYKSCLVTLLTKPIAGKGYESPVEAIAAGLILILQFDPKTDAGTKDEWQKMIENRKFVISYNTTYNLDAVGINRKYICMATEYPAEYVQNKYFLDEDGNALVKYLPERYNTFSTVAFMAPGHPLEHAFNRKILQLIETGWIDIWRIHILWLVKVQSMTKMERSDGNVNQALSMENLYPIFLMQVIGLTLCGVVFVGESVWRLRTKKIPQGKHSLTRCSLPEL